MHKSKKKMSKYKFSFLKEGLPSLKTACAPCMLGTLQNLVIVYTALKPHHRRTSTIVIESVGKILFWQRKTQTVILSCTYTVVIPLRQFGVHHSLRCYSKITFKFQIKADQNETFRICLLRNCIV